MRMMSHNLSMPQCGKTTADLLRDEIGEGYSWEEEEEEEVANLEVELAVEQCFKDLQVPDEDPELADLAIDGAADRDYLADQEQEEVGGNDGDGRFGDEETAAKGYPKQKVKANQCTSRVVQQIKAPPEIVWSVVRRFDKPQSYKHFVRSCRVQADGGIGHIAATGSTDHTCSGGTTATSPGTGPGPAPESIGVGTIRVVKVVSGLPASTSMERLELLDDERRIMSFSVLGGDHRLKNYCATTSLHEIPAPHGYGPADGRHRVWTLAEESYVVDIPEGNTSEETITFVDTVIKCNLQSLAQVSERLAARTNI